MPILNSDNVPTKYHELIPYVTKLGISDDVERELAFDKLSEIEKEHQVSLLRKYDNSLDEWLAGPESDSNNPSNEYVAFSAWRMGVDYVS